MHAVGMLGMQLLIDLIIVYNIKFKILFRSSDEEIIMSLCNKGQTQTHTAVFE